MSSNDPVAAAAAAAASAMIPQLPPMDYIPDPEPVNNNNTNNNIIAASVTQAPPEQQQPNANNNVVEQVQVQIAFGVVQQEQQSQEEGEVIGEQSYTGIIIGGQPVMAPRPPPLDPNYNEVVTNAYVHDQNGVPKKRPRKKCSYPGGGNEGGASGEEGPCQNYAIKNGVCKKHGAKPTPKKLCSHPDGCTNQALNNGVCQKHGAKVKMCSIEGCTNQCQKRGLCRKHGAFDTPEDMSKPKRKRECKVEGCTKCPLTGGLCSSHGGKSKGCSKEGCTNKAGRGGVCMKHGAKQKLCKEEGCTKYAQIGGVCRKHGAVLKTCSVEGCTNVALRVSIDFCWTVVVGVLFGGIKGKSVEFLGEIVYFIVTNLKSIPFLIFQL